MINHVMEHGIGQSLTGSIVKFGLPVLRTKRDAKNLTQMAGSEVPCGLSCCWKSRSLFSFRTLKLEGQI